MSAPQHYTADRADRCQAGQLVHQATPVLGAHVPADGWVSVTQVDNDVTGTVLTFDGGATWFVPSDRIVYLGWDT